tara:strand:+ start:161 stop:373 length:213 start_codon:yes stop_codon:yes gene_type:complete
MSNKDLSENISFLKKEIEYAKSKLEDHDTGHIHTAIGWLESRLRELYDQDFQNKGINIENLRKRDYSEGK